MCHLRLNISLDTSQTSRSPGRATPAGRGAKRKRVDISEAVEEYSQRSSSSGYARSASAKGGMDIAEVDPEGKFIKLTNTTSKVSDGLLLADDVAVILFNPLGPRPPITACSFSLLRNPRPPSSGQLADAPY